MGRSWAYARLSGLVADGLLVHRAVLYRRPGLLMATAAGLRWCGLERLGVYRVGPGGFRHAQELATVAVALDRVFPDWRMLSERELRLEESAGGLVASARLAERPGGGPLLHRPDLALVSPSERTLAVEVELSLKAPRRLAAICRGWARARHVDHIYYLALPAPARAVARDRGRARARANHDLARGRPDRRGRGRAHGGCGCASLNTCLGIC